DHKRANERNRFLRFAQTARSDLQDLNRFSLRAFGRHSTASAVLEYRVLIGGPQLNTLVWRSPDATLRPPSERSEAPKGVGPWLDRSQKALMHCGGCRRRERQAE